MKFLNNITNLDMVEDGSGKVSFTPSERTELTTQTSKWANIGRYGFTSRTSTNISFNDSTYTFTLTDAGSGWSYFRNGVLVNVIGNKTVTFTGAPPASGNYYIYIDNTTATLEYANSAWDLTGTKVPVAVVIWNDSFTPKYILNDERHTCLIDRRMHMYEHVTAGTKLVAGGNIDISTLVLTTYTDVANTYKINAATIYDEDIILDQPLLADGNGSTENYSIFRRIGTGSWTWARSIMPYWYDGTSIRVDDATSGGATPTNNKYMNVYLIITNASGDFRYVFVNGRVGNYNTVTLAQAEDYTSFDMSGFPFVEYVWAARITYLYNSGQSNKGKCQIAANPQRLSSSASAINVAVSANHNGLAGLQGGVVGEYYHLSSTEYTNATVSGASGVATVRTLGTTSTDAALGDHIHDYAASLHTQAESTITFTDSASGNVSTSNHGFAPKAVAPTVATTINVLGIASGETTFSNKTIFSGLTKISVGTSTPSNPVTGDLWIDTN